MKATLFTILSLTLVIQAYAGSATWNLDARTGKWTTATNWTPATVPNGPADIATFATSNTSFVTLTGPIEVSGIVFNSGAGSFTLTVSLNRNLLLSGAGVMNDSGIVQKFVLSQDAAGHVSVITFSNSATAGELTTYFDLGEVHFLDEATAAGGTFSSDTDFFDNSSAGNGTFIVNGAVSSDPNDYGFVNFHNNSSAAQATFTLSGAAAGGLLGGDVTSSESASAADATFTVNGGQVSDALGGQVEFLDTSTAGNCTIVANGSDVSKTGGASILFAAGATLGNATIIINGGSKEGASALFNPGTNGGTARIEVFDNGLVDLTQDFAGITIGSLEGTGLVNLSQFNLTVGSNNLGTTFSGIIQGTGSIGKIGTGTLTLTSANSYPDGTTVSSGTLLVSNVSASGTGTGAVSVNGGTLGGSGIIAGAVTVGTNTGAQAFLAPSKGAKKPATLTVQSALTINDDSTYTYQLNTKRAGSDKVIANGVVIDSGAKFSFRPSGNNALTVGQVFTVISNTSANPIAGTFHNLKDGQIITVNGSNLQASYTGGDGNDLTLTVVSF